MRFTKVELTYHNFTGALSGSVTVEGDNIEATLSITQAMSDALMAEIHRAVMESIGDSSTEMLAAHQEARK